MYYVGDDEGMIISSSGISNTLIASSVQILLERYAYSEISGTSILI